MQIVSAFTDIGRGHWTTNPYGVPVPSYLPRSTDVYIERFERMTKLDNSIIAFVDADLIDQLPVRDNVQYHPIEPVWNSPQYARILNKIERIHNSIPWIERFGKDPVPERWNSKYVFVNWLKTAFILDSLYELYLNTKEPIAWLDFGYFRESPRKSFIDFTIPKDKELVFFSNGKTIQEIDNASVHEAIMSGEVFFQGCHIVGTHIGFRILQNIILGCIDKMLTMDLVDDDQTLLLMAYRELKPMIHVEENSSSDWFGVFTN